MIYIYIYTYICVCIQIFLNTSGSWYGATMSPYVDNDELLSLSIL